MLELLPEDNVWQQHYTNSKAYLANLLNSISIAAVIAKILGNIRLWIGVGCAVMNYPNFTKSNGGVNEGPLTLHYNYFNWCVPKVHFSTCTAGCCMFNHSDLRIIAFGG